MRVMRMRVRGGEDPVMGGLGGEPRNTGAHFN